MNYPSTKISYKLEKEKVSHMNSHPPLKSGVKIPFRWQEEASKDCIKNQYEVVHAAGGSGKTTFAVYNSIVLKKSNKEIRKFVFTAPMTTICDSYAKENNEFLHEGEVERWKARRFGSDQEIGLGYSSASYLKDVLFNKSGPAVSVSVTHAGWIQFWKKLNYREKKRLLQNIVIYIDECHHCKPEDSKGRPTELGIFLKEVLEIDNYSCSLILLTATFFRGDLKDILPKGYEKKFKHYHLPHKEYMDILKIKYFNFDYVAYDEGPPYGPLNHIEKTIKKHPDKVHIIALPATGDLYRNEETLDIYIERLKTLFKPDRILDLITPETQDENKRLLIDNPEGYDVAIACRLFIEGTDWPPAAVVHNTNFKRSALMYTQIVARLFRRYENKEGVKKDAIWCYTYLQRSCFEGKAREIFSDRLNILFLSILMAGHLDPIQIPLLPNAPFQKTHGKKEASLLEIMDKQFYEDFMSDIIKEYDFISSDLRNKSKEIMYKKIKKITEKHYNEDEFLRENVSLSNLKSAAVCYFYKIFLNVKGDDEEIRKKINISFIREEGNFDKIWEKIDVDSIGSLVYGTKEPIDNDQMEGLLDYYDKYMESRRRDFESWGENAVEEEIAAQAQRATGISIELTKSPPKPKVTKDITGQWIKFTAPHKWKPNGKCIDGPSEQFGFVTGNAGDEIEINFYKDEIVIENNQVILKQLKRNYVYRGSHWGPPHYIKPPSLETPKKHYKLYLFENPNDLYLQGRKLVKKVQVKIPVDWITETLNI